MEFRFRERWTRICCFCRNFYMFFGQFDQMLMIYRSWCYEDDILSYIILIVIILDHLFWDCLHIVLGAKNGKGHDMGSVYATMGNFDCCLQGVWFLGFTELAFDGAAFILDIFGVIERVCDHIAYYFYCFVEIILEYGHHVWGILSRSVRIQVPSNRLYSYFQLLSSSIFGPLKMQMLQKMRSSTCLRRLIPTPTVDKHSNGCQIRFHELGGNSYSIW